MLTIAHSAAGGSPEHSCTHALSIAAISRMLRHPQGCHVITPNLGLVAALAVQALDPGRPALKQSTMQPIMSLVRELTAKFPQVACHGASLQLAVGSPRILGAQADLGQDATAHSKPQVLQAPAVAVFDMNGGTKRKVLLVPVLVDNRPASTSAYATNSSRPGSASSQYESPGRSRLQSQQPGSVGLSQAGAAANSAAATTPLNATATASRGLLPSALQRDNSAIRAEAAFVQHWFGHETADSPEPASPDHLPLRSGASMLRSKSPVYPSSASSGIPLLTDADVMGGIAAVGFNPAADALAAYLSSAQCIVVWSLQAHWSQMFASLGSRAPVTLLPLCYLPVSVTDQPPRLSMLQGADSVWAIRWLSDTRVSLYMQGQCVANFDVVAGA